MGLQVQVSNQYIHWHPDPIEMTLPNGMSTEYGRLERVDTLTNRNSQAWADKPIAIYVLGSTAT